MAELLLELFSEEIPARMQQDAAERLKSAVADGLKQQSLSFKQMATSVTPRRLALVVDGLPASQGDTKEERRGPRSDAPEAALQGFLRSTGLKKEQLEVRKTDKGEFYFAVIESKGQSTSEVLIRVIQDVLTKFVWPKSMRWGNHTIRWVRPLHSILCVLDGAVLPVKFGHITAGNTTTGHRFMAPKTFTVKNAAEYKKKLEQHNVMVCEKERKAKILSESEKLAQAYGLKLRQDEGLLSELTGLVEWPVPLIGKIEDRFMHLPPEVLSTAMRSHQKYFSVAGKGGALAPHFITVANVDDGLKGERIIAGNERVLRARLEDARFFWDQDRRHGLESRLETLKKVIFHARLGSVHDKVMRIADLAKLLAFWIPHANLVLVERAALLCKADLTTEMVGEFPELQGLMGSYYALESKEESDVAAAIKTHYSPVGPHDNVPTNPVSIAVALADKIDTLVGLFAIGEKPTGSKDPYALRRAALGVIRIILENNLRMPLKLAFEKSLAKFPKEILKAQKDDEVKEKAKDRKEHTIEDLLAFFADRLKVMLKEQQVSHDLIEAVFDGGHEDDLDRLVRRAMALKEFVKIDDGADLLAAYRRATNIVLAEEKKDGKTYDASPKHDLLEQDDEIALYEWFEQNRETIEEHLKTEQYAEAMEILAGVRQKIDKFFDKVTVNCDNAATRKNRLNLLSQFRAFLNQVANFSKIEL